MENKELENFTSLESTIEGFLEQAIRDEVSLSKRNYKMKEYKNCNVRISFGMGAVARIPWIAFLYSDNTVSNGIYPVLLYNRKLKELVVSYGISETESSNNNWPDSITTNLEIISESVEEWPRYRKSYTRKEYRYKIEKEKYKTKIKEIVKQVDQVIEDYKKIYTIAKTNNKNKSNIKEIVNSIDSKEINSQYKNYLLSGEYNNDEYNRVLKNINIVISDINLNADTDEELSIIKQVLNLFLGIRFINCTINVSNLTDTEDEAIQKFDFVNCSFEKEWFLNNFMPIDNVHDDIIYNNCKFKKTVLFEKEDNKASEINYTQFNDSCKFEESIVIDSVTFNKKLFTEYIEVKKLEFTECIFNDKFFLTSKENVIKNEMKKTCSKDHSFNKIEKLSFTNCEFNKKMVLEGIKVGEFNCYNTDFLNVVKINCCNFDNFKIERSIFKIITIFEDSYFKKLVNFDYVTFNKKLNLSNSEFEKGLNLTNTNLDDSVNFLNTKINDVEETNRETFRIIKRSFDAIGNVIEANKYYAYEMQAYQREKLNCIDYIVFRINKIVSNFGQNWMLALVWLLATLLIFFYLFTSFSNGCYEFSIINYIDFISLKYPDKETSTSAITIWYLNKVLTSFFLYHFIISTRRQTTR